MSFREASLILSVLIMISGLVTFALRARPGEPEPKEYRASLSVLVLLLIALSTLSTLNPHNGRLTRAIWAIAVATWVCALIVRCRKVSRQGRSN